MTQLGGSRIVAHRGGAGSRPWPATACARGALAALIVCTVLAGTVAAEVYSFRDRRGTQHFTNVPTDSRFRAMPLERARVTRISYTAKGAARTARRVSLARNDGIWIEPPANLSGMIVQTALRYGVEPALVHAVVRAESDFDHLAISSAGAQGLMQLMPGTASDVGVRNAFHPQENLDGGVYYLRQMIDRFSGNVQLALAAYNAGPATVERFGGVPPYAETIEYLQRVFRFRQEYLLRQRGVPAARPRVVVASR
ncbi:MAG: lytic transglycosylase domain-containing protein [Thermodesulfobacteriota bacterium]